jgi:hypothetical protein
MEEYGKEGGKGVNKGRTQGRKRKCSSIYPCVRDKGEGKVKGSRVARMSFALLLFFFLQVVHTSPYPHACLRNTATPHATKLNCSIDRPENKTTK